MPEAISAELGGARPPVLEAQETTLETQSQYRLVRVELRGSAASATQIITLDYYRLPQDKSPVILLLPISGGGYEAESHFARYFARRGLAVVLVRRRELSDETPTPSAIEAWLKENATDNRRVLDWIESRPELDRQRIGLFGISMGGIQASILVALDPRLRAATLGLAGGDVPFILAHSTEKSIAKHRNAYLRAHHLNLDEFQAALREAITYDPMLLAPSVDPGKVLLVLGCCDTVVPYKKGRELREKLGRPETVILPTGHYTAVLCIPYVEHQCLRFFRKHLDVRPPREK